MKKETIFKHEINESIQANAALNCLKNRNKHKQINEVAPVVAAAGRMLLPMLRPVITKLVQKALVKIGTHARPTEVLKLVMGMLTKGEFAKKMAEKCGQTWNEIPSNVKKEIQNAIIDAFKAQSPQEQEEEDYTNDEIPSPNFSYRMSFMVWAMREIIPYLKEISQVCAQADPTALKHAVMKILKTRDTGIPETHRSCQEWAKENYDWVEMELNGEYDAYQKKWSKPFNIPSEQEESTDEKGAFALKLVKKFKNRMTPDYAKRPEMFMMLKLQNALKKPLMSLSKEEYRAWAKAICDACETVFGTQEQEELTVEQEEDTLNAYYSQDEPDYENDHHGIWLIINLMRKKGMLRAKGIEGRDNVDDGHAIDAAYDLIEQKLNEEGMWIGDDDHEAERFVSFFGEEIAAEAMKSAIHNQEQEESFDDAEDFISNVVNLMEDEGMIDNSQWDAAYYTVEEMVQSNPELLQYPSYKQFLNVFGNDILSSLNNQEQEETSLDTEWFSDLEEQEAYYENFRAIAELVADQIDRENGKYIDNNMDTIFAIVREVWNNNPDDLYIWDFDDVQEDDCYKFFDKHYEEIKNEYLKREHNNIMDATHDDLFDGMMNN